MDSRAQRACGPPAVHRLTHVSRVALQSSAPSSQGSRARARRILFAAGPGDVIGTWRHWREGRDDPSQVALTYSGQFFDVCRELGARGYIVAYHSRKQAVRDGDLRVEHRPIPFIKSRSAALYHLGQLWSAFRMIATAVRFRADVLVIYDGTCHWFPLRVLPWLGVRVVPTFFCKLWSGADPPSGRVARIIRRLDRPLFQRSAHTILSMSGDITRQIERLTGGRRRPVIEFLPTYRRGTFADCPPPAAPPFRVLYAGRMERVKGVFDLLEIARGLRDAGHDCFEFDLCGAGSAMQQLRQQVQEAKLSDRFRLHGHCTRDVMRQMYDNCHVLIVPTRTDFAEGFNQVVVEGILSGRPVITSSACPALQYVREAVLEVPPDDIAAYRGAILRLHADPELYEQKRRACARLQPQFYDVSRGWAAALRQAAIR